MSEFQEDNVEFYNEHVREILSSDYTPEQVEAWLKSSNYFPPGMTGQKMIDAGRGAEVEGVALTLTMPW